MLNVDRSRDNAAFASARMKIDEKMEVAIYQRTPKERAKEDPYVATYEQGVFTCVRMNQLFTHTLGCLRRIAG